MVSSWRPNPLLVLTTLALGALSLGTSPLSAQHISLSPAVGVYIPTQELVAAATTGTPPKQEISVTVGGRFGLWFGNRIGIEATGDYAPSKLRFSATGAASTTSANIFTGSGRILIFVIPESSPVSFRISGGAGLVSRSGTAYQNSTDKNDIGGTGGFALGFRLGRIDPATGALKEFPLPDPLSRPRRLAVDEKGQLWYTDYARNRLGQLDPATGKVREFPTPGGANSGPYAIAIAPDGRIYYNESGKGQVIVVDPGTVKMTAIPIPTPGSVVRNMSVDSTRARLWLAESGVSRLGKIELR